MGHCKLAGSGTHLVCNRVYWTNVFDMIICFWRNTIATSVVGISNPFFNVIASFVSIVNFLPTKSGYFLFLLSQKSSFVRIFRHRVAHHIAGLLIASVKRPSVPCCEPFFYITPFTEGLTGYPPHALKLVFCIRLDGVTPPPSPARLQEHWIKSKPAGPGTPRYR